MTTYMSDPNFSTSGHCIGSFEAGGGGDPEAACPAAGAGTPSNSSLLLGPIAAAGAVCIERRSGDNFQRQHRNDHCSYRMVLALRSCSVRLTRARPPARTRIRRAYRQEHISVRRLQAQTNRQYRVTSTIEVKEYRSAIGVWHGRPGFDPRTTRTIRSRGQCPGSWPAIGDKV